MPTPKQLRKIRQAVEAQGGRWEVREKTGHIAVWPADRTKKPVFMSGTPSDWRAVKNFVAQLRRAGFDL